MSLILSGPSARSGGCCLENKDVSIVHPHLFHELQFNLIEKMIVFVDYPNWLELMVKDLLYRPAITSITPTHVWSNTLDIR